MTIIQYFADTDTLYILLSSSVSTSSQQLAADVVFDFGGNGQPVGIEIEDINKTLSRSGLAMLSLPVEDLHASDHKRVDYNPSREAVESVGLAEARELYNAGYTNTTAGQMVDRQLIAISQSLSPSRAAQLIDFARFLEAQSLEESLAREDENMLETQAENARWDELLASDESQALLEKLADEALAEHRADLTKPMAFADDGKIVPG